MCENELTDRINEDLKMLVAKTFNIEDMSIDNTTGLTNGGICLDSMQTILLISRIEKHFEIRMDTNILLGDSFRDIETLSGALVQSHKSELMKKYEG